MGFKFKTPPKYKMFIAVNLAVTIVTYSFFWRVTLYFSMMFMLLIILEIALTAILIVRGETIRICKVAVIFLTMTFLMLLIIYYTAEECCSGSKWLWITWLLLYCVFRSTYVGVLLLLDKEYRKECDKRELREQTMAQMEPDPFSRPQMAPLYPNQGALAPTTVQGTAPSAPPVTPGDIGFEAVLPQSGENKTGYGWAI